MIFCTFSSLAINDGLPMVQGEHSNSGIGINLASPVRMQMLRHFQPSTRWNRAAIPGSKPPNADAAFDPTDPSALAIYGPDRTFVTAAANGRFGAHFIDFL